MERLVGMQAQEPPDPYVALWTRLADFNPEELVLLLESRAAVRATTMLRTTIHLVTASDAVGMRPILQPVAERTFIHTPFAKALDGVDLGEVIARGRELLAGSPMTIAALGRRLAEDWPDREPGPLGYVIRFHVPLVQIPPRGLWGRRGGPVAGAHRRVGGPAHGDRGVGRRPGPALPGRLRPRHPGRRADLVVADGHPPHPGATAAAAANLSRRGWTRAVRRSGRSAAGPGDARAGSLPAGVRQHLPLAPGPKPDRGSTPQGLPALEGLRAGGRLHPWGLEGQPRRHGRDARRPASGADPIARIAPRSARRASACCASSTRMRPRIG